LFGSTVDSHHSISESRLTSKGDEITGCILAGGKSSRMAANKALLTVKECPLITETYETLNRIFDEILVITNSPEEYESIPARKIEDIIPGKGPLGGLYTGLTVSKTRYSFVVACDMPFLNDRIINYMLDKIEGYDVVVPCSESGIEPLHAIYSKTCLEPIYTHLVDGDLKVQSFFDDVKVAYIRQSEIMQFDPEGKTFMNINSDSDLQRVRDLLANG